MSFQPIGEKHAIQSVVFTIAFDKDLSESDIGRIMQEKDNWKALLPREERQQVFVAKFGTQVEHEPSPPIVVNPLLYSRVKPDGGVGWQLRCSDNQVSLVCSVYTRWDDIWGTTKATLLSVLNAIKDRNVKFFNLQTKDVFLWTELPHHMSADLLFNLGGEHFPSKSKKFGPFWHLHNGYFQDVDFSIPSLKNIRMLNKLHIDALSMQEQAHVIIDHNLRCDFLDEAIPTSSIDKNEKVDYLQLVFTKMHQLNKDTLKSLLVKEMQERILLNG